MRFITPAELGARIPERSARFLGGGDTSVAAPDGAEAAVGGFGHGES
jgi:hypothetical protein